MMRGWVAAVMVLVACGDDAFDDVSRSGSRLRVEWNKAEDGAEVASGRIYDRDRQEFCYPTSWHDGVTRCTRSEGYIAYSDPQCTQRLVVAGVQGEIANDFDPMTCSQLTAWVAGAPSAATVYYEASATACMGPFTVDPSNPPLRIAEKEIDPNQFATLALSGLRGGGRLQTVDYTSSDGFRTVKETHDTDLGTPCTPTATGCLPDTSYELDYVDAACTQQITGISRTACSPPPKYAQISDPVCPNISSYRTIGGIVGFNRLYQKTTDGCTMVTPSADYEYHSLGAEITPAHLAPAAEAAAGRRLQPIYYAGEGIAASAGQLFDTQVGVACSWQPATDGATRCLPVSTDLFTYLYGDASCTQPVNVAFLPTAECRTTPPPQYAARYLAPGNEIHQLRGRHAGTLYQRTGNACAVGTFTGYDAYDVDPGVVDPTSFEMSELVLDP